MIKQRIVALINAERMRSPDLESLTGISRYTWSNIRNTSRQREIKEEEILAMCNIFPQYRWWILTGEELPEVGQISPAVREHEEVE